MSDKKFSGGPSNKPAQIRRAAVSVAFAIWGVGIFFSLYEGERLLQAVSSGGAVAIGGIVGWTIYHLVSRRNDGMLLIGASGGGVTRMHSIPFLSAVGLCLVVSIPIALILGLTAHRPKPILASQSDGHR